jgi:hypothetical protein
MVEARLRVHSAARGSPAADRLQRHRFPCESHTPCTSPRPRGGVPRERRKTLQGQAHLLPIQTSGSLLAYQCFLSLPRPRNQPGRTTRCTRPEYGNLSDRVPKLFLAQSGSVFSSYAKSRCLSTRYRDPDNARRSWWKCLPRLGAPIASVRKSPLTAPPLTREPNRAVQRRPFIRRWRLGLLR